MSRIVRYLPESGALVEITQRTIEERFAFRPSEEVNAIFVGCLARAQKHTAARVHAVAVMSNHFHLLASFDDVRQMAKFMRHFKANLSKEIGRLTQRRGPLYPDRYRHIPVSEEREAQLDRLHYLLSQGVKEGLVASPLDWPGVQSAQALLEDLPLTGIWLDRTRQSRAKSRGQTLHDGDVQSVEQVHLEPLPALAHLDLPRRRKILREMIGRIEEEGAANRRSEGTRLAGREAVCRRSQDDRPSASRRSPAPRVHAYGSEVRQLLLDARRWFEIAYREAADRLKAGALDVAFPPNCYPPGLPFVPPAEPCVPSILDA